MAAPAAATDAATESTPMFPAHAPGAPYTWECACKKVAIEIDPGLGAPYYSHGDCFCDDCNIRARVAQDKYCGPADKAGVNGFGPNGAVEIAGFSSTKMRIKEGEEHIGYYRAATKRGEEFTKKSANNAATVYATCCGTWLCFHGPGNLMETNAHGLVGWERRELAQGQAPVCFSTLYSDVTGVALPAAGIGSKPRPFSMACGDLGAFICTGLCCDNWCQCCGPCHATLCCRRVSEPLWDRPPVAAEMYRGKPVEYIGDQDGAKEKYLSFGARQLL
jgi:hypothetical protein